MADSDLLELGRILAAADERFARRCRELEGAGGSPDIPVDPVVRAAVAEAHACIEAIGRLPASTAAGLLVKARIVVHEARVGPSGHADGVARTLVEDLERLAGAGLP